MATHTQNIQTAQVMRDIKEKVLAEMREKNASSAIPRYQHKVQEPVSTPLLYQHELSKLNEQWNKLSERDSISSHRTFFGPFIVKAKRLLRRVVLGTALNDYLEAEKEFLMNLINHLNASARYIDARDKELFWSLINKLDGDVAFLNDRVDRLYDDTISRVVALEANQTKI